MTITGDLCYQLGLTTTLNLQISHPPSSHNLSLPDQFHLSFHSTEWQKHFYLDKSLPFKTMWLSRMRSGGYLFFIVLHQHFNYNFAYYLILILLTFLEVIYNNNNNMSMCMRERTETESEMVLWI